MKNILLLVLMFVLLAVVVSAEEWEIKSKYYTIPNSTLFQPGTQSNPYVISNGNQSYEVKPKYYTIPGSTLFEPGTSSNPYVIERIK